MATFPTAIPSFSNPTSTNYLNSPAHATQHSSNNDETVAIATKVGITGSADTTSMDYKLSGVPASDKTASLTGTETFTNKRITKRIGTTTDSATPTPDADANDIYTVTALAQAATFGAPTGTPTNGQGLIIRIKDAGTAKALSFNAIYRFSSDMAAPTTTVLSKTLYMGFIYNSTDTKWDCVAILNNF